jgi:glycosyltransferase involved in cell wall biosynthesis
MRIEHSPDIKVSVAMITYNQEKFIAQALESVLMQETDFNYEVIIGDDCSTDGTRDIVRRYAESYPEKIVALLHPKNLGPANSPGMNNFTAVLRTCRGQYIALLEGDDYWTDPCKLQKQVEFLELHVECSICCHKVLRKNEENEDENYLFPSIEGNRILSKDQLYGNTYIQTCSVMFKNIFREELIDILQGFRVGDLPLFYFYAQKGCIAYLDELMAAYRIHVGGVWSKRTNYEKLVDVLDTNIKLRKQFRIRGAKKLDEEIIKYIISIIKYFEEENNLDGMKKYLVRSYLYFSSGTDKQKKIIKRTSMKIFLPWLYRRLQ